MSHPDGKRFDVIGLGGAAWDILGLVRHYPQPGEKEELISLEAQGGGQAATAMVAVARGGGRAALVGTVGDDEYADLIRASLATEGVDQQFLVPDPDPRADSHLAFCMIEEATGDRAIFYLRGSKRRLTGEDLDRDFILSARCLLVDTHHSAAAATAAEWCRETGIPVVTDLERSSEYNEELLRLGTHHILPEHYLLEYFQETDWERAAERLRREYQPEVLIVTHGAQGSDGYQGDRRHHQPAYCVAPVVDTTGAGDVYHGIFAYGLTLGYDLPTNMEFASLVAGLKCRKLGGRAGIPTQAELAAGLWRLPLP